METATDNKGGPVQKKHQNEKFNSRNNSNGSRHTVNGCLQEQIDRCSDASDEQPLVKVDFDVILPTREGDGRSDASSPVSDCECVIYEQLAPPTDSWDEIKQDSDEEEGADYLSTSSSSYCPSAQSACSTPPLLSDCTEATVSLVLPLTDPDHQQHEPLLSKQQLLPPAAVSDPEAATILEIQCTSSDCLQGQGQHVERFESRLTHSTAVENGQVVSHHQYEESELKQRQQHTVAGQELSASTQLYHREKQKVTTTDGGQRLAETSVQNQETHESTEYSYQLIEGQKAKCAKTRRRSSTSSHNSILQLGDELTLPSAKAIEPIHQIPRGWNNDTTQEPEESSDELPEVSAPLISDCVDDAGHNEHFREPPPEEQAATADNDIDENVHPCVDSTISTSFSAVENGIEISITGSSECCTETPVTVASEDFTETTFTVAPDDSTNTLATPTGKNFIKTSTSSENSTETSPTVGSESSTEPLVTTAAPTGDSGKIPFTPAGVAGDNDTGSVTEAIADPIKVLFPATVARVEGPSSTGDLTKTTVKATENTNDTIACFKPEVSAESSVTVTPKVSLAAVNNKSERISVTSPSTTKQKYPVRMDKNDKFIVSFNSDSSDSESELSDDDDKVAKHVKTKAGAVNGLSGDHLEELTAEYNTNNKTQNEVTGDEKIKITRQPLGAMEQNGSLLDSSCLADGDWYQISSSVAHPGDSASSNRSEPAAAAAQVGSLIDINSPGTDQETAIAGKLVAGPETAIVGLPQQQPTTGEAKSFSQELLAELADTSGQDKYNTASNEGNAFQQQFTDLQQTKDTRESLVHYKDESLNQPLPPPYASLETSNGKSGTPYTSRNMDPSPDHTDAKRYGYSAQSELYSEGAGDPVRSKPAYRMDDLHGQTGSYDYDDDQPVTGKKGADVTDLSPTSPSFNTDDPDSTESLIKRILEEARRERETGGGRYRVDLAEGRDEFREERKTRHFGGTSGYDRHGDGIDDADPEVQPLSRPRHLDLHDSESSLLERRLANIDQEKKQAQYNMNSYDDMPDSTLYPTRKYKAGKTGYEDIDAESDASSGKRRVMAWRTRQRAYDEDDEDVFLPTSSRYPPRAQNHFDNDYEDDEDYPPEPEEPLFTDEDFVPSKREETDDVVRERTYHIRSVVDNQSDVVDKLRRASQSFDELQDEIKELKQSLLETQMRRDAADTDIMDFAQSRSDPRSELKWKPVTRYNPYDDEDFEDEYTSGYKPKSKASRTYDEEEPLEMDPPIRGRALGSLARSSYGGATAYDQEPSEPSYSTGRYKPHSLGGVNRFRRTHSLYDDIGGGVDMNADDDDGTGSFTTNQKYGRYQPKKYGSFDLESSDRLSSYSSSLKSSYVPSYRPPYRKSLTTTSDYNTSDLSTSPSSSASSRYGRFSRSQTLSADYGSSVPPRPRSPSNFEPPTTSRFLKKVRDRKKAQGEDTSDDISSFDRTRDKPFRSRFLKKSFDSDYSSMATSSRSSLSSLNTTPDKMSNDSTGSTATERRAETATTPT